MLAVTAAAAVTAWTTTAYPYLWQTSFDVRSPLRNLLAPHVAAQRAYHEAKARRLANVHHRLDRLAQMLFVLAVGSVTGYLLLKSAATFDLLPHAWAKESSSTYWFQSTH